MPTYLTRYRVHPLEGLDILPHAARHTVEFQAVNFQEAVEAVRAAQKKDTLIWIESVSELGL